MNVRKENFKLCSVKVQKGGGLSLTYEINEIIGEEVYNDKETVESSKIPSPDLTTLLASLKPSVAQVYGYQDIRDVASGAKVEKDVNAEYNEILRKIDVTGISLSGTKDNAGLIITATLKARSNQKMSINTHRLRYVDNNYGFETDLEAIVNTVSDECYAYLFEGKKAQLELFDQPQDDTD